MNGNTPYNQPTPLWMKIVIIACMLPALAFPSLLAMTQADTAARTLVWLYPFYVLASGLCSWICYGQRREMSWILIILMLLSHAAIWVLIYQQ